MGSDYLYDYHDFINRVIWIPTHMTGHDQLLGAYWFLRALFLGSLFAFILLLIKEKIVKLYRIKESYIDISSLVVTFFITVLVNHFRFIVPYFHCGSQPSLAASFILIVFFSRSITSISLVGSCHYYPFLLFFSDRFLAIRYE